jgi:hypothetical protein
MTLDLGLGHGFDALRGVAQTVCFQHPPVSQEGDVYAKLSDDFRMECRKFVVYRAHRFRARQWVSLQRLRALLWMLAEVQSFAA